MSTFFYITIITIKKCFLQISREKARFLFGYLFSLMDNLQYKKWINNESYA